VTTCSHGPTPRANIMPTACQRWPTHAAQESSQHRGGRIRLHQHAGRCPSRTTVEGCDNPASAKCAAEREARRHVVPRSQGDNIARMRRGGGRCAVRRCDGGGADRTTGDAARRGTDAQAGRAVLVGLGIRPRIGW
jgi:hypothetical protein